MYFAEFSRKEVAQVRSIGRLAQVSSTGCLGESAASHGATAVAQRKQRSVDESEWHDHNRHNGQRGLPTKEQRPGVEWPNAGPTARGPPPATAATNSGHHHHPRH